MRPSQLPFRYKATMVIAFFVLLGAWAWLVRAFVYEWAPPWLIDVAFTSMVGVLAYYFGYERGQRSTPNRDIVRKHDLD